MAPIGFDLGLVRERRQSAKARPAIPIVTGSGQRYRRHRNLRVLRAGRRKAEKSPPVIVIQSLIRPSDHTTFNASTRVLVRPIGLDMVEVGGSNPPGPTKIKNPPLGGFFGFGGLGLDKSRCSTNVTKGAFGPPQQSEGARRVQSPEAMAIEDIPPGPTSF